MSFTRKEWQRYYNMHEDDDDGRKNFRFGLQFEKNDPMDEQARWRYDLSRLFQETVRLEQPGSNLPSVISEAERASVKWEYNIGTVLGLAHSSADLQQDYETPEDFLDAREKEFEGHLYSYLITEATRNVAMKPCSEELPFRKGEIAIRQMARDHGYDLYKYTNMTKNIDSPESVATLGFNRTCFHKTTIFGLVPPVQNPKYSIYIVHDDKSDNSTRWEVHVVPIKDQHVLKEQLKEYVCDGQWILNFLKPIEVGLDGSIPF